MNTRSMSRSCLPTRTLSKGTRFYASMGQLSCGDHEPQSTFIQFLNGRHIVGKGLIAALNAETSRPVCHVATFKDTCIRIACMQEYLCPTKDVKAVGAKSPCYVSRYVEGLEPRCRSCWLGCREHPSRLNRLAWCLADGLLTRKLPIHLVREARRRSYARNRWHGTQRPEQHGHIRGPWSNRELLAVYCYGAVNTRVAHRSRRHTRGQTVALAVRKRCDGYRVRPNGRVGEDGT
jgi:hypothetical protein